MVIRGKHDVSFELTEPGATGTMMNLANISLPTPPMPGHLWAVLLAGGGEVPVLLTDRTLTSQYVKSVEGVK